MKKKKIIGMAVIGVVVAIGVLGLCFREKIKILYTSLNSFKDENLAHTFQHTPEIQPTKKISKGENTFEFLKEDNTVLADGFYFEDIFYPSDKFMEDTKTSAMLVIKDDVIKYEEYFFGGDENTLFSSNSMGKSFVSALMGIAVSEGCVESIEDPLGKYIPEFVGTELENIPVRACLQMASGIDFDEDKDMSGFSMRTLMGTPAMKVISKYGMQEEPYTYRRYLSINTEILGQVIKNAAGCGLAEYMEEKLWKKIGADNDAYNVIGYGYQWWVPEGNQGEFMAIGVYGQWIYVNPSKQVIIVKTSADPDFMSEGYELKHVEFFRAVADGIS